MKWSAADASLTRLALCGLIVHTWGWLALGVYVVGFAVVTYLERRTR